MEATLAPLRADTLAERLQTVAAWLDTLEGATSEEERLAIEKAMDGALMAAAEKVDNYVGLWKQVEAQSKLIADDLRRLKSRKRVIDDWDQRMRANAFMALKESGQEFVKGAVHSLTIIKTPEGLEIYDAEVIPSDYCKVRFEPDQQAILQALLAGVTVPGARLVAGETVRKL